MARIKAILNAFTGGEISPEVWGRTDAEKFPTMVEEMRNAFPDPRGGARRRDGLHYVLPTKFTDRNSRLIPFVFSREQSYIMELGDAYVRFFRDNGYVEDIGNIIAYLGDGTSTSFIYPYPSVDTADIRVYDENGDLVPDTEYTVTVVDTNLNYAPPFIDARWNLDFNSTGQPWTLATSNVTSPAGFETQLGIGDLAVPVGGAFEIAVDCVSFSYTNSSQVVSSSSDYPLIDNSDYAEITTLISSDDIIGKTITVSYDFTLEDASGSHSSNFYWQVRHNGTVIAEGTELAVGSPGVRVQSSLQYTQDVYFGDTFSIHVRATYGNTSSAPQVSGATQASELTLIYKINESAKLQSDFVPFGDGVKWKSFDPAVGTITLYDSDATNYAAAPMKWLYRAQDGLQIELTNPSFKVKTPGYFIEFNTAPTKGSIRAIADAASTPDGIIQTMNTYEAGDDDDLNASHIFTNKIIRSRIDDPSSLAVGDVYEIQAPFFEDELEELYYAQANDVMIFASDTQKPWRLTRYGPYDWRWDQPVFLGAPWEGEYAYVVGDGSKTVFSYDFDSIVDADIAVYFNNDLQDSGYTIDHDEKTVTFSPAPPDGMRIIIQGVNTYNPLDGYPRTVTFFQERLYFGGTRGLPQTLWGSRAADFYYFAVPQDPEPIAPDDAVEYTIAAYTHEAIEWLSSERVLIIGTSATEHRLAPDQYISTDRLPTVSRMSAYGGSHKMPVYMGNMTVFIQNAGNQVRTFEQATNTVIEKWNSIELDWMASHLTSSKVKEPGYALNPYSLLFMVTGDGDFLTMNYEPGMGENGEYGWAKHNTDGKFKSCASIPEDTIDQIWAIVERDGKRYVEYFDSEVFTDSTLTYPPDDGNPYPPLQLVGGLDHLEGKEVTIVADGSTHPDLIVQNGQVELNEEYQNIEIGLKYIPRIKLQKYSLANEAGHLQGDKGRWVEVWLRIVNSAYPLVDGIRAAERNPVTPMNETEPLITGDVKVYHLGYDRNKQLVIEQDLPLPMHITAVYGVMEVNQG